MTLRIGVIDIIMGGSNTFPRRRDNAPLVATHALSHLYLTLSFGLQPRYTSRHDLHVWVKRFLPLPDSSSRGETAKRSVIV